LGFAKRDRRCEPRLPSRRLRSGLTSNACANDMLYANIHRHPSRSAPKVSYARFILVIVICTCPFILLADGVMVHGIVAGLAAVGVVVVAATVPPGETKFLISLLRPGAALAVIPALWIVIQILPLKPIAHPIWASAEVALGHPLRSSISIDFGASVMALGLYLSICAVAALSAAVAVDRHRAGWVLFTLMGITTLIALPLPFQDLSGLAFLSGGGAPFERAQAVDCTAICAIVAAAAGIRTFERFETRHSNPKRSDAALVWTFAACIAALAICTEALTVNSTRATTIAAGYGFGALIAVAIIRRMHLGPWGVAGIAVPAIGLAVLLIASQPGLRTKDFVLAFAAPSPPALISASQRILADTSWTGTGAGTFAAIMPMYRDVGDPPTSTAPTAAATASIELGRPMLWLIIATIAGAVVALLRAALKRGRDWYYPAAGASCLIALLFLSFVNAGVLGTATAVISAATLGLAFAQSKSRTIQ